MDNSEDKEAAEDLLATQPKIERNNEYRFWLYGIRARQLPGR